MWKSLVVAVALAIAAAACGGGDVSESELCGGPCDACIGAGCHLAADGGS